MPLNQQELIDLSQLAKLDILEKEIQPIQNAIDGILTLFASLNDCATEFIEPLYHPMDSTQRLREDQVTEKNHREQFQAIAPLVVDGFYMVPKVIE